MWMWSRRTYEVLGTEIQIRRGLCVAMLASCLHSATRVCQLVDCFLYYVESIPSNYLWIPLGLLNHIRYGKLHTVLSDVYKDINIHGD